MTERPESWAQWWAANVETLGVALTFAFGGSGFLLWAVDKGPFSTGRVLSVIAAGQFVTGIATAFVHGYLGWSIFVAPAVGSVCGLVALPMIFAIAKGGKRVETRADDIADKGINMIPGKGDGA